MSEVQVEFIGRFREIFKIKSMKINVESEINLLNLLKKLSEKTGFDVVSQFLGSRGEPMEEYSLIILNGKVVNLGRLSEYVIKPGDRVVLSPSVAGGG
ncbi:MAG: MoaD/ThiS family protein [Crenarchaeota archaeon]|nr:MoaD/ThiS family protein [Thermoproteota archaeon]MDW8034257.1 MoaD/ThiS family protein [Nitrososphaerota archaeon]